MASTAKPEALQDVMLAMDVVDTLRHADKLVVRELDSDGRRERLIDRLRQIYEAQGIEVTDAILREGVLALEQERFAYAPQGSGFSRLLARIYIARSRWLKPLLLLLAVAGFLYAAWFAVSVVPARMEASQLPAELRSAYVEAVSLSEGQPLVNRIESIYQRGTGALERGDSATAQAAVEELDGLVQVLAQSYELRVVNEPGAQSGVFRVPDVNSSARNYYLIVEPVDNVGRPLRVNVRNEEDGKNYSVKRYGLRVSEAVFNSVGADKQDDGIIQDNVLGRKAAGMLEPEFLIETPGGVITEW